MPRISRITGRLAGRATERSSLLAGAHSARRPADRMDASAVVGGTTSWRRTRVAAGRAMPARLRVATPASAVPAFSQILPANDLSAYRRRIDAYRQQNNLSVRTIGEVQGESIEMIKLPSVGPKQLSVVITGGVHGNEPCGPAAALLLIDQLIARPELREGIEFSIVPMVNPRGYSQNHRRTPEDVDLNRVFLSDEPALPKEVTLVRDALSRESFDLALDLHSGSSRRNGFWTLHRNAEDLLASAMARFGTRWSLLSGDTKPYTMSHPGVGTSKNRSTLKDYFIKAGAKWSVTLEAPGSLDYMAQVLGQNDMVHEIVTEAKSKSQPVV